MLTIEKAAVLKDTDVFATSPHYALVALADVADELDLPPDTTIIQEGALQTDLYIIVEGEVRVHQGDVTLATLGMGQVVGEMEMLAPAPGSASVTTTQPVLALRIGKDAFDEVMAERPEIARAIITVLIQRLRDANVRLTAAKAAG